MRKKVACFLLIAIMVTALAACQSASPSAAPAASAAQPAASSAPASAAPAASADNSAAAPVEIVFWHNWGSGPSGQSITESVDAYNNSQSAVKVSPLYVAQEGGDSITSKMITAVASGNPPEVMLSSRYGIAEFMDAITIVNDLIARDGLDLSQMYPWGVDEASYDGQMMGLPYDGTSRALYYNKDHFRAAGLDPENPPKTTAELAEYAEKLTIRDGSRISQYGFVPWMGEGWLYTWGWAYGGEFYNKDTREITANDPRIVEALTWMTDVAKNIGAEAVTSFYTTAGADANNPFTTGQLSMVVQGNWFMSQLAEYNPDLDYGTCDIPGPDGVEPTTFVGGRALVIPKGITGDRLEAAWDFVKWMCMSEEGQSKKLISKEYPVMKSINESIYKDNEAMQDFIRVLPNGHNRPVILAGNMMWTELGKAPDRVLQGETPQAVLDDITAKITQEIANK